MTKKDFHIARFDSVSSTNDVVKGAIRKGEPEGFVALARQQSGGYGRQGRAWASPVGGMYMSVLLRPHVTVDRFPTLSLAVGIAVRRALASILEEGRCIPEQIDEPKGDSASSRGAGDGRSLAEKVLLKWPNDVVFGEDIPFRKLCGISLEAIGDGVCIGIGVNVFPPDDGVDKGDQSSSVFLVGTRTRSCPKSRLSTRTGTSSCPYDSLDEASPAARRNEPIYLADLLGGASQASSREQLSVEGAADAVLRHLTLVYEQWQQRGFASLREEYEQYSALRGRYVAIEARDGSLIGEGEVRGIDDAGRLLLKNRNGEIVEIASGEAHIRQVGVDS